jgi:hypothetical protein
MFTMVWIKVEGGGYLSVDKIMNIYSIICMPKFGMQGKIQVYAKTVGPSVTRAGKETSDITTLYSGNLPYLDALLEKIMGELEAKLDEHMRDPEQMNSKEVFRLREKIQEMKYKGLYALEDDEIRLIEDDVKQEGDRVVERIIRTIVSAQKFNDPAIIDLQKILKTN